MPAKDAFHETVRTALQKEGWKITHDPLTLEVDALTDLYIDLGAEKLIAAERGIEKIAVETKSFVGQSAISEFHTAIGQFINYRYALADTEPDRSLYLAVPQTIFETLFTRPFVSSVVRRSQVYLLIYSITTEEIVRWQT